MIGKPKMKSYEVGVGGKTNVFSAMSPNTLALYRGLCSYFLPNAVLEIKDLDTQEKHKYTRKLDDVGNLVCIYEDGKEI